MSEVSILLFYLTSSHRHLDTIDLHRMRITQKYIDELPYRIIGCAIEVHKQLGPGLLESVYEKYFIGELQLKGLNYVSQRIVPINYKGIQLDADLRFDVLVEDLVVTELKQWNAFYLFMKQ